MVEKRGGEYEKKIKICHVKVQISYVDGYHCVYLQCTNKIKIQQKCKLFVRVSICYPHDFSLVMLILFTRLQYYLLFFHCKVITLNLPMEYVLAVFSSYAFKLPCCTCTGISSIN